MMLGVRTAFHRLRVTEGNDNPTTFRTRFGVCERASLWDARHAGDSRAVHVGGVPLEYYANWIAESDPSGDTV